MTPYAILLSTALVSAFAPTNAQPAQMVADQSTATSANAFVATAQRTLAAPIIIDGAINSAVRIRGAEAAGLEPGFERFYVTVDVLALIKGQAGLPPQVGYVVDVPLDRNGRTPRLKKLRILAFARPVSGRPAQLQLIGPHAQQPWSPALDAMIRKIAKEAVAPDAPPQITGVGNAFHVPGTIPGEGETQIFVNTSSGAPISLSVLTRPNTGKHWAVALGDIVDDAAKPPPRDSLLWYRLACGLPRHLPDSSLSGQNPANADAAREDYQFVLDALGPCN